MHLVEIKKLAKFFSFTAKLCTIVRQSFALFPAFFCLYFTSISYSHTTTTTYPRGFCVAGDVYWKKREKKKEKY